MNWGRRFESAEGVGFPLRSNVSAIVENVTEGCIPPLSRNLETRLMARYLTSRVLRGGDFPYESSNGGRTLPRRGRSLRARPGGWLSNCPPRCSSPSRRRRWPGKRGWLPPAFCRSSTRRRGDEAAVRPAQRRSEVPASRAFRARGPSPFSGNPRDCGRKAARSRPPRSGRQ